MDALRCDARSGRPPHPGPVIRTATSARDSLPSRSSRRHPVRKTPAAEMAMKIRSGRFRIEEDRVQPHAACARLPEMALGAAQTRQLPPRAPAVHGLEERCILRPCIDGVGIRRRGLQMPDTLEFPGMLCAIVPLMRPGDAVILEFVAHRLPGFSSIVGALDLLAEPAAGLRRKQAIRLGRGSPSGDRFPSRRSAARLPPTARAGHRRSG